MRLGTPRQRGLRGKRKERTEHVVVKGRELNLKRAEASLGRPNIRRRAKDEGGYSRLDEATVVAKSAIQPLLDTRQKDK